MLVFASFASCWRVCFCFAQWFVPRSVRVRSLHLLFSISFLWRIICWWLLSSLICSPIVRASFASIVPKSVLLIVPIASISPHLSIGVLYIICSLSAAVVIFLFFSCSICNVFLQFSSFVYTFFLYALYIPVALFGLLLLRRFLWLVSMLSLFASLYQFFQSIVLVRV